jgi:hypothetical protein
MDGIERFLRDKRTNYIWAHRFRHRHAIKPEEVREAYELVLCSIPSSWPAFEEAMWRAFRHPGRSWAPDRSRTRATGAEYFHRPALPGGA